MESDEVEVPGAAATVDLLRRATDELERLHHRVPSGRWSIRALLATRSEIVAGDAAGRTEHVAEARQRSARWILAMSPAVAHPIVAWLRETAEVLDRPRAGHDRLDRRGGCPRHRAARTVLSTGLLVRAHPPCPQQGRCWR